MLRHLCRYEYVAYDVLHNITLPQQNLQPVTVGRNGKDNQPGITLNIIQFSFDAFDVAMQQSEI